MTVAPVGLLVIRAWLESGAEPPLRVVVRMTTDTGRGFERELVFSEPGPVGALVHAWLAELLVAPGDRPAPGAAGHWSRDGHAPSA